jgi:hypothetical protein
MAKKPAGGGNGSRWRGRFFNFSAAVSLLLCVALCILWVRSYWRWDSLRWVNPERETYGVRSEQGSLHFWHGSPGGDGSGGMPLPDNGQTFQFGSGIVKDDSVLSFPATTFAGFGVGNRRQAITATSYWQTGSLFMPSWFASAMLAILPYLWFRRWRRNRPAKMVRRCPFCGYDLRATPERCPECGRGA